MVITGLISFEVHQACHIDDLPSTNQGISDGMVEYSISGRAKTVIKSWFGDGELSLSDSTLGLVSLFNL